MYPQQNKLNLDSSPNIKIETTAPLTVDYLTNQPNQKEMPSIDSFFLFDSYPDIEKATPDIFKHFTRFGLIMHTGNERRRSKTVAMSFPSTLNQAKQEAKEEMIPKEPLLHKWHQNPLHQTLQIPRLNNNT
jgi:hypothetical protein